ncbi:MAG: hypothetical protein H6843_06365 [Rhodospirillaceae bacterium]|nr:hypothetical protein [Rhodospirillaceae bacterium]
MSGAPTEPAADARAAARAAAWARHHRRRSRRAWRQRNIVFPLEAGLARAILAMGRRMPIDWVSGFGGFCGAVASRLIPRLVRDIEGRLAELGWPAEAARHGAREAVINFGRTLAEYAVVQRLWDAGRVRVDAPDAVEAAMRSGRPVVVVSGHFSNWEALLVTAAGIGLRIGVFYRPQKNPVIDGILKRIRRRFVTALMEKGQRGLRDAVTHLRDGGAVGILVDERSGGEVTMPSKSDEPGLPLRIAVRLARTNGAVLLPVRLAREGGARFVLTSAAPLALPATASVSDELAVARWIDRWLASQVAARPQDWAWIGRVDGLAARLSGRRR